MKRSILLLPVLLFCFSQAFAQEKNLNRISFAPILISSNAKYGSGEWNSVGVELSYQRMISNRIDLTFGLGKGHMEGRGSFIYELDESEKTLLNLTSIRIGMDYGFVRKENLKISGGLSAMRSTFRAVNYMIKSDAAVLLKETSFNSDLHVMLGLKIWNKLGENTGWVTNLSYGPRFDTRETFFLSTGISINF
jgi:hypothetical protein